MLNGDSGTSELRPSSDVLLRDPWWVRDPARLERECRELFEANIPCAQHIAAAGAGVCRLELTHPPIDGVSTNAVRLVAVYPDEYPYFPVHVEAPDLTLVHHQNPFARNLCLLGRGLTRWRPASDTLAGVLATQLRPTIVAGQSNDVSVVSSIEEHVPEPFSTYYGYGTPSVVLLANETSERVPADVMSGTLIIAVETDARQPLSQAVRGVLLEIRGPSGQTISRAEAPVAARFAGKREIEARWIRVDTPVVAADLEHVAETVFALAEATDDHKAKRYDTTEPNFWVRVRAVLFPEEHRWRGEQDHVGDGWAISVKIYAVAPSLRRAQRPGALPQPKFYLARLNRYAERDLLRRAPALAPLRDTAVAVFGLGCVGAPSALEFARGSVRSLRLLDHDDVDAPTTMRWPVGIRAAGFPKVQLLRDLITVDYPFVRVDAAEQYRLGEVRRSVGTDDDAREASGAEVMHRMLDGADLLYDACAEPGVQHFLAERTQMLDIPYVGVSATPGGWGGIVIAIDPRRTRGCWVCAQHWFSTPTTVGGFVSPSGDEDHGDLRIAGCTDTTYTGANVDLAEVALMGVRMAFGILAHRREGGTDKLSPAYPRFAWDVAVLSLRDEHGNLIPPQWTPYVLERHPACATCAHHPVLARG